MIRRYILSLFLIILSVHLVAGQDITPTPSPTLDPDEYGDQPFFNFQAGDVVAVRTPPGDNLRLRTQPHAQAAIVVNMANGTVATYLDEMESLRILDSQGHFAAQEYWYKIKVRRESDPDYDDAPEGWALGRRNSVNFLVPAPRQFDPNYTPPPPCSLAPAQRLTVGAQGRVLHDATAPLYAGPHDPTLVVELAGLDVFTVLDEPICGAADNYAWRVQYQDFTGWLLETDSDADYRYLVEPYDPEADDNEATCPDSQTSQLEVGMLAQPNAQLAQPLSVRTRPTITGTDAALLYPGEIVTIAGGPLCYSRDPNGVNRSWWLVENERGVKGWIQETEGTHYLITPYDPSQATPTPTIDAACVVTTLAGVNLRNGAGSTFEAVGSAAADTAFGADGQALADDGVVWWRLSTGEWVASNLTAESGDCTVLPIVGGDFSTPTAEPSGVDVTPSASSATPTPTPSTGCVLTTLQGVNLRTAPKNDGERVGSAAANAVLYADGQFAGSDGLRWWRLAQGQPDAGTWVREDFVRESEGCQTLPTVQP